MAANSPAPESQSILTLATMILVLSVIGLFILALALMACARGLKRPIGRDTHSDTMQSDPWFEAGRRLEIEDGAGGD